MKQEKIFNILKKMAFANEGIKSSKHAACLVYKNEIISFGMNKRKSHPFQAKFGSNKEAIYIHAETEAIYNAIKNYGVDIIKKSTLYVLRADKQLNVLNSCPCLGCQRAINTFNIKKVYYSDNNEFIKM